MRIDSKLLAIDPKNCGCTECLTGQYVPVNYATDDQIQALFLGIVSDHTYATWDITQTDDNRFTVTPDGDQFFTIDKIAFPITVDHYTLDVDMDTVVNNLVHLQR